ncbi:hypothetical protein CRG98_045114 [Punica granatum]|uniref:Gnk2-homologous domain-containing protein n=1 Tax=Punica granatum TaxID=22663 RepID=A0A2I0HS15_PUNGR|nr:hypothetical protein CRG98_045114 [Punica granatum]
MKPPTSTNMKPTHRQSSSSPIIIIFFLLSLLLNLSYRAEAQDEPTYLFHSCSNATVFSPNSTYQRNLNVLLSNLSSNSSDYISGFTSGTAGLAPLDRVYGLFLCRGDQSQASCRDCVGYATGDVLRRCPKEKLRYDSTGILDMGYGDSSKSQIVIDLGICCLKSLWLKDGAAGRHTFLIQKNNVFS